jgi:primosomal protein N' (replication factor Y) (superfamily II helicase)
MQAHVIAVGAVRGVEELTYLVPPDLTTRIQAGHRVLVPLGSRMVTGVVVETGERLAGGNGRLRPILEILEPRPLFDHPHLRLMRFLASYYMVPVADVYRSVMPAGARVESKTVYAMARAPGALRRAAFTRAEAKIAGALERRAMAARQLRRLGDEREIARALDALVREGIVEAREATRGRHREAAPLVARLAEGAGQTSLRGAKQREVAQLVAETGEAGISVEELEAQLAGSRPVLEVLKRRGVVRLDPAPVPCDLAGAPFVPSPYEQTPEQRAAVAAVAPAISSQAFEAFLLFGVTASGKTEVYLELAAKALSARRQVIVLVPEIALGDELVRSFRARFGALVGVAHSAQSLAERWQSWMAALGGTTRIMIGPRSLIFAPIHDAGLIVVDEEHDPAYKNEEGIRYNARDLAVALGRFSRCPVVLGSATPSTESFLNARRGRYRMLRLPRRVKDRPMAEVEVVDLRREMGRPRGAPPAAAEDSRRDAVPLSAALIEALRQNLAAGGQSMVFLNRRGYHNFLQCHACGNVIACSNCSVSMTFHMRDRSLRCHYCGSRAKAPDQCPECAAFALHGQGFGTERLQAALVELMPGARIERLDSDTGARRGARAGVVGALRAGEIDVLVGTQMITKGFDFPRVTLAAVVVADLALNLPDFRSAERTFQLLTQVAGRAGRGERPGRVIIQTWTPHHYSIRAARDQDYIRFVRRELELRRELFYPPYARLAMVRIEGENPDAVSRLAAEAAEALHRAAAAYRRVASLDALRVLGPSPAPIERIKKRYRWQVMLKSQNLTAMRTAVAALNSALAPRARRAGVYLGVDIDPVRML